MNDDEIPTLIDSSSDYSTKEVPLTIITGFLGSGKSTFLSHILTAKHGFRIAVILNEFGDTADIESKTISVSSKTSESTSQEEETHILELPNGCLCCSIKDTGVAAIEQLMTVQGKFDHILLECSGLADPGPIAKTFWHNEEYLAASNIVLDSVVCVVDGMFAEEQIQEDLLKAEKGAIGEWTRQVLSSDTVLISKSDLNEEKIPHIRQKIQSLNPVARIFNTTRGVLQGNATLDDILGVRAYSTLPSLLSAPDHSHEDHEDCTDCHRHSDGITSMAIALPVLTSDIHYAKLDEWIRTVLWEDNIPGITISIKVLRSKGLILRRQLDGTIVEWIHQGVRGYYDTFEASKIETMDKQESGKLVLIGNFAGVQSSDILHSVQAVL